MVDIILKGCKFTLMKNSKKRRRCKKPFFYRNSKYHLLFELFFVASIFFIIFIMLLGVVDSNVLSNIVFSLSISIVTGYIVSYFTYYFTVFVEKKSMNNQFIHRLYFINKNLEDVYNTNQCDAGKLTYLYKQIVSDVEKLCILSSANPMYVSFFVENFKNKIFMYGGNVLNFKKDVVCFIGEINFFLVSFPDSHHLRLAFNKMEKHVESY